MTNRNKKLNHSQSPAAADASPRAEGRQKGFLFTVRDINQRKHAEREIAAARGFAENLLETASMIIVTLDADANITSFNRYAEQVTGYARTEVLGHNWFDIFAPPDIQETLPRVFGDVLRSMPDASEHENRILTRGGDLVLIRWNNSIIRDAHGAPRGVLSMGTDITEYRRASDALRESEETHRLFVETFQGIAYQTEFDDSPPVLFEGTIEKITGYPAEAFTDGTVAWLEIVHPDDRHLIRRQIDLMHRGRDHLSEIEYRIVTKAGHVRWVRGAGRIVRSRGRDLLQGTVVDITARKRSEEQNLSLERQVLHSQKLESLGLMAGGIAHDFNNLLMTILGNADLVLLDLPEDSPLRAPVLEIDNAARNAADLARQMLAYAGKSQFVIEPLDLNGLIREISGLLEVNLGKRTRLDYDLIEDPPAIEGDATQIKQVVMNLITNAAEAIGDGGGAIDLITGVMTCDRAYLATINTALPPRIDEAPPAGCYLWLEVRDSGGGMERETIKRIFDPFFTTKFTGRGLGMSAVLGIVRGHGGALKIDSEPGGGTTFRVLFPVSAAPCPKATPADAAADSSAWTGSGTVLFADGDEAVRAVGLRLIAALGMDALAAADGPDALRLFAGHRDDIVCVLLDDDLPDADTAEICRAIRARAERLPIFIAGDKAEREPAPGLAEFGISGYLRKPFSLSRLRSALAAAVAPLNPTA